MLQISAESVQGFRSPGADTGPPPLAWLKPPYNSVRTITCDTVITYLLTYLTYYYVTDMNKF